jgi:hypothetical protein
MEKLPIWRTLTLPGLFTFDQKPVSLLGCTVDLGGYWIILFE